MALGEKLDWGQKTVATLSGAVILGWGAIAWRAANLMTKDLSVNALAYATPAFALGWLWAFGEERIGRPEVVAAATVLIVAANLGLYLHQRSREAAMLD